MLKFSRKLDYAIVAMAQLCDPSLDGPISARTLADRCRVPASILANILKELSKGGIVRSVRGVNGGYELAVPPRQISVGTVVRLLEGPTRLVECVPLPGDEQDHSVCDLQAECAVKTPLRKLHGRIQQLLDEVAFDQLHRDSASAVPLGVAEDSC